MVKRLLIVGGTGFIGKNLTLMAVASSFRVTVLSINEPIEKERVKGVSYLQSDLTDYKDLQKQLLATSFEYVVNLAGYIDHSSFFDGGRNVIETHFGGLQNIIQLLDRNKLKRFVQIGSSDEYGDLAAPQKEDMRESSISPYSFAKTASTHFLQMLHRTEGFPSVILRLFLVYGLGQDTKRFLPQIIQGCLSNKHFPVSSGEQLRDFCYVDDISRGILKALINDPVNGEVINLASGKPITIRKIVERVKTIVGGGTPEFGKIPYRVGENMELVGNISKAVQLLDWSPVVTIDEGIDRVVKDYKNKRL